MPRFCKTVAFTVRRASQLQVCCQQGTIWWIKLCTKRHVRRLAPSPRKFKSGKSAHFPKKVKLFLIRWPPSGKILTNCHSNIATHKRKKQSKPRFRNATPKITYSNKGFSSWMSRAGVEPVEGTRLVTRSRLYSSESGTYGSSMVHRVQTKLGRDHMLEFRMRGGGCINFFQSGARG